MRKKIQNRIILLLFMLGLPSIPLFSQACLVESMPSSDLNYSAPRVKENLKITLSKVVTFSNGEVYHCYVLEDGTVGFTPYLNGGWDNSLSQVRHAENYVYGVGNFANDGMSEARAIQGRRVNGQNIVVFLGKNTTVSGSTATQNALIIWNGSAWSTSNGTPGGVTNTAQYGDVDIHPATGDIYVARNTSSTLHISKYSAGAWTESSGETASSHILTNSNYTFSNNDNIYDPVMAPDLTFVGTDLVVYYGIDNPNAPAGATRYYPRAKKYDGSLFTQITINVNGQQREGLAATLAFGLYSEQTVTGGKLSEGPGSDAYVLLNANQNNTPFDPLNEIKTLRKFSLSTSEATDEHNTLYNRILFSNLLVTTSNELYASGISDVGNQNLPFNKKVIIKRDATGSTSIFSRGTNDAMYDRLFFEGASAKVLSGAAMFKVGDATGLAQDQIATPLYTFSSVAGDTTWVNDNNHWIGVNNEISPAKFTYLPDGTPLMAFVDSTYIYTTSDAYALGRIAFKKYNGTTWVNAPEFGKIEKIRDFDVAIVDNLLHVITIDSARALKASYRNLVNSISWNTNTISSLSVNNFRLADDGKSLMYTTATKIRAALYNFPTYYDVTPDLTSVSSGLPAQYTNENYESFTVNGKTYCYYGGVKGMISFGAGGIRTGTSTTDAWTYPTSPLNTALGFNNSRRFDFSVAGNEVTLIASTWADVANPAAINVKRVLFDASGDYDATATSNLLTTSGSFSDISSIIPINTSSVKLQKIGNEYYVAGNNGLETKVLKGMPVASGGNSWTATPSIITNSGAVNFQFKYSQKNGGTIAWGGQKPHFKHFIINASPITASNLDVCQGNTANISVIADPATTISWTGPNSFTASSAAIAIPNVQSINTGNYIVNVNADAICTSIKDTVILSIPSFSIDPQADDTICVTNSHTITTSGSGLSNLTITYTKGSTVVNGTYNSTNNNFTANLPITAGVNTWVITATHPAGCAKTDTVVFTGISAPNAVLTQAPTAICQGIPAADGTSTTFIASGGTSYELYVNGVYQSTSTTGSISYGPQSIFSSDKPYEIRVYGSNGCYSSLTGTLNINAAPASFTASYSPSGTVCQNVPLTLSGSDANLTYSQNITGLNPYIPTVSGSQTIYVQGVSNAGCKRVAALTLNVTAVPTITVESGALTTCAGAQVLLSTSTPGGTWSGGPTQVVGANTYAVPTTTSSYSYLVPGGACPSGAGSVTITVNSPLTLTTNISADTLCSVGTVNLSAQTSHQGRIGTGTFTNSPGQYPSPYGNSFEMARQQLLYRISELNAQGFSAGDTIKALSWEVTNLNNTLPLNNYNVQLGTTLTNQFGTANGSPFLALNGTSTVYTSASYVPTLGVNTHTFSSPYIWNGTENLVIEICFSNYTAPGQYNYNNNVSVKSSTTSFVSNNVYINDDIAAGVCTETVSNDGIANKYNRPDVTLTGGKKVLNWTPLASLNTSTGYNVVATPPVGSTTYTVSTSGACSQTESITISVSNLNATATTTSTSCGASTGAINLSVTGALGTPSFVWSNGATTEDISGLAAGTYSVTITDDSNCSGYTATYTVTAPGAPVLSTTGSTTVNCFGDTDANIDLSVTGGTGTLSYNWSNGASSQDLTGLGAGSYTVIVTDAANCSATTTVNILEPTELMLSGSVTNINCAGDGNGAIDISVTGGTTNYSYAWSNGAVSQDLTQLNGNTYTVTVTDANGCTKQESYIINEPAPIEITGSATDADCGQSNGAVATNVNGGSGLFSFSWNSGQTTQNLTGVAAGSYVLTATDGAGCSMQGAFSVNSNGGPVVTGAITNASCASANDGAIDITVTGSGTITTSWNNGANTEDITGLAPGTYVVTVTDTLNCPSFGTYIVDGPVYTANAIQTGVTTIEASISGASYQWINCATNAPVAGATSQTFTANANGSYAVIVSNGSCSDTTNCVTISAVGLEELSSFELKLHPNPASSNLTITSNQLLGNIEVYTAEGRLVEITESIDNTLELNVVHYNPGVYFIKTNGKTLRFVKQ